MSDAKVDRSKYLYPRTVKGKRYLYFRMADGALVPLPLDKNTKEFERSYDACLKARRGLAAQPVADAKPVADVISPPVMKHLAFIGGTVGKAIETYMSSPEWAELRDSSKYTYRTAFDVMRDKIGATLLREYDLDSINLYSAELAIPQQVERVIRGKLKKVWQGGPSTADLHVFLLSSVWQVCRKFPEFGIKNISNPCADADRRYSKAKNPSKPWKEEHQDQFRETAPDNLQLGYLMLHFLGQRGGDCVKVRWDEFDGKGILVAPEKGDDMEPDYLKCPKPLLAALKRAQKKRGDAETILVNSWGKPWTNGNSLSQAIRLHLIKIGLAKRGTKTISMHGLRKNASINAAFTYLGTAGIKSLTLHKSDAMAEYYAKKAEQRRMNEKVVDAIDEMYAEKAALKVRGKRANIRRVK
jgi:integrase